MSDKERIEKLRIHANITWRELAERLNVKSVQTFSDIRNGKIGISTMLRQKILKEFPEINPDWLNGDSDKMRLDASEGISPLLYFPSANDSALYNGCGMVEYPKGCILMLRRVTSASLLVSGENYLIDTSDFSIVRRVIRESETSLRLIASDNSEYEGSPIYRDIVIDMADITKMCSILGYIMPEHCITTDRV